MHQRAGWVWRFSGAVWTRMTDSHFGLIAAGVAFYAMFAVFPGLTATIAIWSLLSDPAVIADYLRIAEGFLPDDAAALVHDQVMALLAAPRGALGWATALSVGVAIYAARAGVAALIQGMDVVHQARPRALLWGWVVDLTMTAALIVALMAAMATIVIVPLLLSLVPLGAAEGWLLAALPWMAMFLLVLGCLGLLYRYGPNVPGRRDAWVTPGTLVATLAWAAVSFAFSAYLANFDSYNRIYGSIGAVAALLMWLYLSAWSVLMGAAINAELDALQRDQT